MLMKTKIFFLLFLVMSLLLVSCSRPTPPPEPLKIAEISNISYYSQPQINPDKSTSATLYSLTVTGTKNYIVPAEYQIDSVFYIGDHFFGAVKDNLYRVYNNGGRKLFKTDYQSVEFKDSLFVLYDGNKFFIGLCDEYLAGTAGQYIDAGPYDSLYIGNHQEVFYKQMDLWSGWKADNKMTLPADCKRIICIESQKDNKHYYLVQSEKNQWTLHDATGKLVRKASATQRKRLLNAPVDWKLGAIESVSIERFAP